MAGKTREQATPPDADDRYWLTHILPVCREIIREHPEIFAAARTKRDATQDAPAKGEKETQAA